MTESLTDTDSSNKMCLNDLFKGYLFIYSRLNFYFD